LNFTRDEKKHVGENTIARIDDATGISFTGVTEINGRGIVENFASSAAPMGSGRPSWSATPAGPF